MSLQIRDFIISASKCSQEIEQTTLSELEASVLLKLLVALQKQITTTYDSRQCQTYIDKTVMTYFDTLEKMLPSSGSDDKPTGHLN